MGIETDTAFMVAKLEVERQVEECKKSMEHEGIKEDAEISKQCESLLSDLEDLLKLFEEHDATKTKSFGKLRRKKVQFKLAKKVMGLKRKYKPLVERMNEIVGE